MNRGSVTDLIIFGDTGLFAISGHLWRTNPPSPDEPGRRVPLIRSLPAFAHHFIYDVAECPAMIVEVRGEHVP